VVVEPDGLVLDIGRDGDGERGDRGVVACVTEGRVEAVEGDVRDVSRGTWAGERRLGRGVVTLGDCVKKVMLILEPQYAGQRSRAVEPDDVVQLGNDRVGGEDMGRVRGLVVGNLNPNVLGRDDRSGELNEQTDDSGQQVHGNATFYYKNYSQQQ
jgi:hypothetical protein